MRPSSIAQSINFDRDIPGALPGSWTQGVTGKGAPRWAISEDASAPSKPNVLQQSGAGTFPWCVLRDSAIENGFVEVKFKAISGDEDQAGGVVWRWQDANRYYVARANALENNVSLYYTEDAVDIGQRNSGEHPKSCRIIACHPRAVFIAYPRHGRRAKSGRADPDRPLSRIAAYQQEQRLRIQRPNVNAFSSPWDSSSWEESASHARALGIIEHLLANSRCVANTSF